jgi:hypothetical protein
MGERTMKKTKAVEPTSPGITALPVNLILTPQVIQPVATVTIGAEPAATVPIM